MSVTRFALIALIATITAFPANAAEKAWVTADQLNRRTCPSTDCGAVGKIYYREGVRILEKRKGWARITKYYDASCFYGRSEYVDFGNAACSAKNGITDGQFAEWVSLKFISRTRPADPAAGATGTAKLIGHSDGFRKYKAVFVKTTDNLIASGKCTKSDFQKAGGWTKSTNFNNAPVYFTYCGGRTRSNRIYLDVRTGKIFR